MKLLLLGSNGQIGTELRAVLQNLGELHTPSREECDLANEASVRSIIQKVGPNVIVNAAAYTAVDKAESEPEVALAINGTALGIIGNEARILGAQVVHYSTDYVFDGTKSSPYAEDDETIPVNAYGRTKLAGELELRKSGASHLILRTSWVFSSYRSNFLKTILRLALMRDELKVVADQFGTPTSARYAAQATAQLIKLIQNKPISDTIHLAAQGQTSWHLFARAIVEEALECGWSLRLTPDDVIPITTAEYPTPAKRPHYSYLSAAKLSNTYGLSPPPWRSTLKDVLVELNSKGQPL